MPKSRGKHELQRKDLVLDVGFMRPLLVWRCYWIDGENVMSKETGGPAFPQHGYEDSNGRHWDSSEYGGAGLTLRDYFAAKAMQGDLSFAAIVPSASDELISQFANHYYRIADAMLKARNQ